MSGLTTETPISGRPNPAGYRPDPYSINLPTGTFTDLVVTGTFNGDPIGTGWLTPDGPATLNNKKLVASTNSFIDAADTKSLSFDLAGAGSTTVRFSGATTRLIDIPDSAADTTLLLEDAPAMITAEYTFMEAPVLMASSGPAAIIETSDGGRVSLEVAPTAIDTTLQLPADGTLVSTTNTTPWAAEQTFDDGIAIGTYRLKHFGPIDSDTFFTPEVVTIPMVDNSAKIVNVDAVGRHMPTGDTLVVKHSFVVSRNGPSATVDHSFNEWNIVIGTKPDSAAIGIGGDGLGNIVVSLVSAITVTWTGTVNWVG